VYIRQRFARRRYKGSAHTTPTHLNPPRADVDGDDAGFRSQTQTGGWSTSAARFWFVFAWDQGLWSLGKFQIASPPRVEAGPLRMDAVEAFGNNTLSTLCGDYDVCGVLVQLLLPFAVICCALALLRCCGCRIKTTKVHIDRGAVLTSRHSKLPAANLSETPSYKGSAANLSELPSCTPDVHGMDGEQHRPSPPRRFSSKSERQAERQRLLSAQLMRSDEPLAQQRTPSPSYSARAARPKHLGLARCGQADAWFGDRLLEPLVGVCARRRAPTQHYCARAVSERAFDS
jgi:hypothetical protein